jgi:single-strand DNA-binding protein
MAGLNEVKLMGNLAANAEFRNTQSGQPVTSFRIICNERYYSQKEGKTKERAEGVNCVLWGKRGKGLYDAECLQQGQSLYVSGRLQTRSYKAQDGTIRYVTEVVVGNLNECIQLLSRRGSQVPAQPADIPPPTDDDSPLESPPKKQDDFSEE